MQKMLSALGLCSAPVIREQPKKSAPKAKAQERMKEKTTFSELKNCVRSTLEPFLYRKTHRNPIVIPVIINSKATMEELQNARKTARKPRKVNTSHE